MKAGGAQIVLMLRAETHVAALILQHLEAETKETQRLFNALDGSTINNMMMTNKSISESKGSFMIDVNHGSGSGSGAFSPRVLSERSRKFTGQTVQLTANSSEC